MAELIPIALDTDMETDAAAAAAAAARAQVANTDAPDADADAPDADTGTDETTGVGIAEPVHSTAVEPDEGAVAVPEQAPCVLFAEKFE